MTVKKPTYLPDTALLSPFWWVSGTAVEKDANVRIDVKEVKGIRVPVIRNRKPIDPYTRLFKYVPAAKSKVSSIRDERPLQAKKKARTSA